jgi:hypothetical protein
MMEKNIDRLVDETLNSFDGIERATPRPFLLTRVLAAMQNREAPSFWTKAGALLSKPAIAFTAVLLILFINGAILVNNLGSQKTKGQTTGIARDEFAVAGITMYDLENP